MKKKTTEIETTTTKVGNLQSSNRNNEETQIINIDDKTKKYITRFTTDDGSIVEEVKTVTAQAPIFSAANEDLKVKLNIFGADESIGKIKYDLNFKNDSFAASNIFAKTKKFILYKSNVNLKTVLCWEVNYTDEVTGEKIVTEFNSNKEALKFMNKNLQEDDEPEVDENFEVYSKDWSITKTTRDVPIQRVSSNKKLSLKLDKNDANVYTDVTTEMKLATVWSINPIVIENNQEAILENYDGKSFKTKDEAIAYFTQNNLNDWLIVLDDLTERFTQQIVVVKNEDGSRGYKVFDYASPSTEYNNTFLDQLLVAKALTSGGSSLATVLDPSGSGQSPVAQQQGAPVQKGKKQKKTKEEKTVKVEEIEYINEGEVKPAKAKASTRKKWLLAIAIILIILGIGGATAGIVLYLI